MSPQHRFHWQLFREKKTCWEADDNGTSFRFNNIADENQIIVDFLLVIVNRLAGVEGIRQT
ncbi:UNVERIFIED_CONTAM: hypothetical protein FKN15_034061 [Acipenser sinensis]